MDKRAVSLDSALAIIIMVFVLYFTIKLMVTHTLITEVFYMVSDFTKDFTIAEREILQIINKYKISLSQTRILFNNVLKEIEDKNIINIELNYYMAPVDIQKIDSELAKLYKTFTRK